MMPHNRRFKMPHNLQADIEACERVPLELAQHGRWRSAIESILDPDDYSLFARATGSRIEAILDDESWQQPGSAEVLERVMGNAKFVPHPLNAKGLHALRALVAERATRRRRARLGQTSHPLFPRLDAEGIVILPNFTNLSEVIGHAHRTQLGLWSAASRTWAASFVWLPATTTWTWRASMSGTV